MSEKEYIEREVLIKRFETLKEKAETLRDVAYLDGVLAVIDTTPTANVQEVRHGKWIEYKYKWKCSNCNTLIDIDDVPEKICLNYCPHCGAKMDSERND